MTTGRVITLLVQDKQHLRKLQGLLPFFPQDTTVHLLLDDMMSRASRRLVDIAADNVFLLSHFSEGFRPDAPEHSPFLDRCQAFISSALGLVLDNAQEENRSSFANQFRRWLHSRYPRLYVFFAEAGVFFHARRWRACETAIKTYVERYTPSLLVLAEGNVQYFSETFIKAFHAAGAGAIIAPYTFCTPEEPANYYKDHFLFRAHRYHQWFLNPKWFYTYQGQKMIRLPFFLALFYERLGYAPPQPWVLESSSADAILVESEAMKRHYIKQKIPENQICLIGDGAYDRIHAVLDARTDYRARFRAEHGMPDNADKWLLFAVFPDLSSKFGPDDDFTAYHDALAAIIQALACVSGWTIVLSVHPSLDPAAFQKYTGERVVLSK